MLTLPSEIGLTTITRPGSNLILARNAANTAWVLGRRQPDGTIYNLAGPPDRLSINLSAMIEDGAGSPDAFLDAAIAADKPIA
jgi:hypothetical protein